MQLRHILSKLGLFKAHKDKEIIKSQQLRIAQLEEKNRLLTNKNDALWVLWDRALKQNTTRKASNLNDSKNGS